MSLLSGDVLEIFHLIARVIVGRYEEAWLSIEIWCNQKEGMPRAKLHAQLFPLSPHA